MSDVDETEQEGIAYLRGQPVPDRLGYSFGDEIQPNGDIFDIEVVRDSDGVSVGTARGTSADDLVEQAQDVADADEGV
jgi:hypothetical protein